MHKSIADFFPSKTKESKEENGKKEFPLNFYLEWDESNYENNIASWLNSDEIKLKDSLIFGSAKWKAYSKSVVLCMGKNMAKLLEKNHEVKDDDKLNRQEIGILKSHIQKCVRRNLTDLAVRTAYTLLYFGHVDELLRRLAIIIIEDVILNRYYSTLVWLMTASSKGYNLKIDSIINWILGLVHLMANNKLRDNVPDMMNKWKDFLITQKMNELYKLTVNKRSLIMSMQLRKAYGGMRSDKTMLDVYSHLWLDRFLKDDTDNISLALLKTDDLLPKIDNHSIKLLISKDIILQSIDFHCSNICENIELPDDTKIEELEKLIWYHRSSISNKTNITLDDHDELFRVRTLEKWKIVEKDIDCEAQKITKNILYLANIQENEQKNGEKGRGVSTI